MILLRLLIILVAFFLALSGGMYLVTRDRRYLRFAGQVLRFVVFLLLIFAALFVLERYVLTGWGILL
jgi:hypothetical protein